MMVLALYLTITNLVAFTIYGIDKRKAIKGKWRVPESTLLLFSIIGGGIGSMAGMKVFRHKTKKLKFVVGVPFLTLLSFIGLYVIYIEFL